MAKDQQWWLAPLGDFLIWARLRVLGGGRAEVFGSDGETLRYDDEDAARTALLDAEFRAFDGMDADDAEQFGLDLEDFGPPTADNDDALVPLMTQRISRRT